MCQDKRGCFETIKKVSRDIEQTEKRPRKNLERNFDSRHPSRNCAFASRRSFKLIFLWLIDWCVLKLFGARWNQMILSKRWAEGKFKLEKKENDWREFIEIGVGGRCVNWRAWREMSWRSLRENYMSGTYTFTHVCIEMSN